MWFALVGAKGGAGTTTLLYELAKTVAAKACGPGVAAIDADHTGRRSLAIISGATEDLDIARVESPIATYRREALTLVELTESLDASDALTTQIIEATARRIDGAHSVLFTDLPAPCSALVRPFIVRATRVLIVVPPSLLGMTGARAMINGMVGVMIPKDRIVAVLQWQSGKLEIHSQEAERNLGIPVIGEIPPKNDRAYRKAIDTLATALMSLPALPPLASSMPLTVGVPARMPTAPNHSALASARNGSASARNGAVTADPTDGEENNALEEDEQARKAAERRNGIKISIHAELAKRIDALRTSSNTQAETQKIIEDLVREIVIERTDLSPEEAIVVRQEVLNEVLGLGPLEALLSDDEISEIMVVGPETVYVERSGRVTLSDVRFSSESQLRQTIDRIITPLGRRIDESSPLVDARLADGSRVNAIIAPLALDGGVLTIRRFGRRRMGIPDLLKLGALTEEMADFLRACVEAHLNILVSGGTGSGKTTLLNIMSNFIPDSDRIITIEDAAELLLAKPHVVRLESRPPNIEGQGEIKIRDLVRNSLRMRPDRIIVGECRGAEALDMLQAMNTGHDGSLTTLHANSPRDSVSRLEILVMMAGYDLPVRAIREQAASAIDLIIQVERLRDGSRKITAITEVIGMEGDVVTLQDIVKFTSEGIDERNKVLGTFRYTGVQPNAIKRFAERGVEYDLRNLSKMEAVAGGW